MAGGRAVAKLPAHPSREMVSELETQREFELARIERTGHLAVIPGPISSGNAAEVRVIEDVERLTAKLERKILADTEVFIKRHVEIDDSGTPNGPWRGVAKVS